MSDEVSEGLIDTILKGEKVEGFSIDLVESTKNPDSIGEKIAAFATSGGGWLIIGIKDDKSITSIQDKQILVTKMGDILRNCSPIPPVNNPDFIERGSKTIAVYKIPFLGGIICQYKGIPYHRVQDSVKKMTMNEIQHSLMIQEIFSWERLPSQANPSEIDSDELKFYSGKANERNPLEPKNIDAFLITNKAITLDRKHLTNLGLITLSKKPCDFLPQCRIQLIRFKGNSPVDRIASFLSESPIRKTIFECLNFLKLNLPIREHYDGINRIEEPIIPEKALREAIVNMVVHRDYGDPQESLIRIFDDRVEFQNAGAPSKDELLKILSQGIPLHKNQGIYNFLRPVHNAEGAGQGIPIMKKELRRVGLKEPEITTLSNIFHLTMRFETTAPETLEDVILIYGREKRQLTTTEVMDIHALSRPTAIKILNELVRKGYAKHTGTRKNSKYIFLGF